MILAGIITKLLATKCHIYALIKKDDKTLVLCISKCNNISITFGATVCFLNTTLNMTQRGLCKIEMAHKEDPALVYRVLQDLNHSNYQTNR